MKKTDWLVLVVASLAAAALRVLQCRMGFDAAGLPIGGMFYGAAVPCVLLLAAIYFILAARKLPARREVSGAFGDDFLFQDKTAVACAIAGAFLVILGGAAELLGRGTLSNPVLAALSAAGAACTLYAVFALYRSGALRELALLVPVCALVVYLIFLYRTDASDPVLANVYVEILALSALTLASLERAAFAFATGMPRLYVPVSAMAAVLSVTAASERRSLAAVLLFMGCALVEVGFLGAAEFKE